ncbi:helix-turn-helix domain-containing protein [Halosolutus gelatinilyticus]|uniref:helix-turn-helix domain-containing protein n=1 Tax=Halosolutus gelatinilyticus TaxID=2931975 RepID=UPI001FF0E882|nr:helix-turn-helix domain-containing protein [Halosolutus gelatinilyticus]
MVSPGEKSYEEGSIADFAHQAISRIQTHADSDDPQKNLIGLNALLFVFVTGFIIASWLSNAETVFSLTFFVILVVSLVFAAILTLGYLPLMDTVNSFGSESLNGLRLAILLEFFAFTSVYQINITDPAGQLTDRQKEVVRAAITEGYYDIPRRATQSDLAAELGLSQGTIGDHLRRIEAKIIKSVIV